MGVTRIRVQRHRGQPPVFTFQMFEWWAVTHSDWVRTPIALVPSYADAQVIARIAAIGANRDFFGGTSQQPPPPAQHAPLSLPRSALTGRTAAGGGA